MRVASIHGLLPLVLLVRGALALRPGVHKVALSKQYVPVHLGGHVVAHKTAYYGTLSVGAPPQIFKVLFDTGSGHFILPSTACAGSACSVHRLYNRSLSSSAVPVDFDGAHSEGHNLAEMDKVDIRFGVGTVSGPFAEELACLGKDMEGCVRLRIVTASSMSEEPFQYFLFDGVAGLGLEALALHQDFSLVGQMGRQGVLDKSFFGVYLAREDSPADGAAGEIAFGGLSEDRMAESLAWSAVEAPELGYWQVRLHGVRVGNETVDLCAEGGCRAVLDTGTSLLGVPKQAVPAMRRALARLAPEGGADCRGVSGPPIIFDLGPFMLRLEAEDYSQLAPKEALGGGAVCHAALLPVEMTEPLSPRTFIFGEPMLRRYYTTYDWSAKRVGFALAAQGPQQRQESIPPLSI